MIFASETDYKEYLDEHEAVIPAAFSFYARQASQIIKQYTFTNIDENNISAEVKMCCCEIAENLYCSELVDKKSGGASSEAVAGWSKSYESAESRKNALDKAVRDCIYKWLGDTGLLYSGVKTPQRRF